MSQLGLDLKERGMEQAKAAYDVQAWKQRFVAAVKHLVEKGHRFTSEDVIDLVGLPRTDGVMNANNAVGAMMNALARRKVIVKTSHRTQSARASSHGREIAVWSAHPEVSHEP